MVLTYDLRMVLTLMEQVAASYGFALGSTFQIMEL